MLIIIVHGAIFLPVLDPVFNAAFQILTGLGLWIVNQPVVLVVDYELSVFR